MTDDFRLEDMQAQIDRRIATERRELEEIRRHFTFAQEAMRDYIDAMFAEKEKALEAALAAQEKAVEAALAAADKSSQKSEVNAEKWREAANEWRGAMSDRDRELPSRREVETAIKGLEQRLVPLETGAARGVGQTETRQRSEDRLQPWMLWIAGTVVTAVVVISNLITR